MDVFVGAGFTLLHTKLVTPPPPPQVLVVTGNEIDNDADGTITATTTDQQQGLEEGLPQENSNLSLVLSESAKKILLNLLKQENVAPPPLSTSTSTTTNSSSSLLLSLQQPTTAKKKNKIIIHPEMSDETKLQLAYDNQGISLFGSILYIVDQHCNSTTNQQQQNESHKNTALSNTTTSTSTSTSTSSVSTRYIIQHCAYTVIPQKTPALLSSREMICAALHFLCQEYPVVSSLSFQSTSLDGSSEQSTAVPPCSDSIQLPLIYSTSVSTDIERRTYEKSFDWNFATILPRILQLEDHFYNQIVSFDICNNNNNNPLMWLPREMFVPNIPDEQLLRQLYVQGAVPVTMNDGTKDSNKKRWNNNSTMKNKSPSNRTTDPSNAPGKSAKTLQIKRKRQSSTTTLKDNKSDSVDNEDHERQHSGSNNTTVVKKIKITASSNTKEKKNFTSTTPTTIISTVPTIPPGSKDNIVATESSRIIYDDVTDNDDDNVDDSVQFD